MVSEDEGSGRSGGSGGAGERPRSGAARRAVWGAAIGVLVAGMAVGGWSFRQHVAALRLRPPVPTGGTALWSRGAAPSATLAAATAPAPALPPVADPTRPGAALATGGFDLGDPFVVDDGTGYALFTSQSVPTIHVPVVTAAPKGSWGTESDALPTLPPWVGPGPVTGPDVATLGGRWLLYFSAPSAAAGVPCIGVAVGGAATGPYQAAPSPLVCPPATGGVKDPRAFTAADGTSYLVWTVTAPPGGLAAVWAQQLAPSGTALVGLPTELYQPDLPWQQGSVASASLLWGGGRTWLVYSAGGGFTSPADAIGVAWCDSPLGPCGDEGQSPVLASNAQGPGPGSPSVLSEGGQTWLVYNPAYSVGGSTARSVDAALLGFGTSGPYLATSGLPPAPPASQSTPADPVPPPAPAVGGPEAAATSGPAPAPISSGVVDGSGITAVDAAVSQLGVPYVWGGESPGHGFDCSGLVQWAWSQAGVGIPRTAAAQYSALPHVSLSALEPGDLLFYYNLDGDHAIDHVVMYVGSGPYGNLTVVQAPQPGQTVSYAAAWSQGLVGAARP